MSIFHRQQNLLPVKNWHLFHKISGKFHSIVCVYLIINGHINLYFVQRYPLDKTNLYPLNNAIIGFLKIYPLASGLSNGWHYPAFEQLRRVQ